MPAIRPPSSDGPATPSPGRLGQPPALLLAAGRGERMRPLTDTCPKPLLCVQGQPLLGWWLQALARAGVTHAVINTAWLGPRITAFFADQFALQGMSDGPEQLLNLERRVRLSYSHEGQDFGHALETAGGIARALPDLLGRADDVFWLAAGDVFMPEFAFDAPQAVQRLRAGAGLAHLWLVANPAHHPGGDFGWDAASGLAIDLPVGHPERRWTYSSVALLHRRLFAPPWCTIAWGNPQGQVAPLAPLLRAAMAAGLVSAEIWPNAWTDVGTPERLAALNAVQPPAATGASFRADSPSDHPSVNPALG